MVRHLKEFGRLTARGGAGVHHAVAKAGAVYAEFLLRLHQKEGTGSTTTTTQSSFSLTKLHI